MRYLILLITALLLPATNGLAYARNTPLMGTRIGAAAEHEPDFPELAGIFCKRQIDIRHFLSVRVSRTDLTKDEADDFRIRMANRIAHNPNACTRLTVEYYGPWEPVERLVRGTDTYRIFKLTIESEDNPDTGVSMERGGVRYIYDDE